MKDYERAATFFQAARDQAEPSSEFFANATSNLSNALIKANRYDESFDGYQKAFVEQEQLQDYRNAIVTAANMLRAAARARRGVDDSIIRKVLVWADALPARGERVRHQCNILGASACYYASLGMHDRAAAACEGIYRYLQDPFPSPHIAVYLNELVEWYYECGWHSKAAEMAFANAALLKACGLPDVATRTYFFAGQCALRAYGDSHRKAFLGMFLECSQEIGHALRSFPDVVKGAELGDWVGSVWENTQSLWEQLADNNERMLALQAYKSVKAWDPGYEDRAWELMVNAYHPRNREAIEQLAANGSLRREAKLTIDAEMRVAVEVTTSRRDLTPEAVWAASFPETVYGYLPLYENTVGSSPDEGRVDVVAGGAVYTLLDGEDVTVREEDARALRTDGEGGFLYDEVWGSQIIPYRLSVRLTPGLIPLALEFDPLFG